MGEGSLETGQGCEEQDSPSSQARLSGGAAGGGCVDVQRSTVHQNSTEEVTQRSMKEEH